MALQSLVEGECGGPNSLVKVASHFTKDRSLQQEGLLRGRLPDESLQNAKSFADSRPDELVKEFLIHQHEQQRVVGRQQQTFHMGSLLQEMKVIEESQQHALQDFRVDDVAAEKWAEEYLSGQTFQPGDVDSWGLEFASSAAARQTVSTIPDVICDVKWASEYLEESNLPQEVHSELRDAATDFVTKVKDPKITGTQFMSFVQRLSSGDFDNVNGSQPEESEQWAAEFQSKTKSFEEDWTTAADIRDAAGDDYRTEEFFDKLQEEWDHLSSEGDHPWLSSFETISDPYMKYAMNEDNPLLDYPDPLREGLQRLRDGDIPSAVLLFEAAVQKDPENFKAWLLLGTSQAENENDPLAIAALRKCLELNPNSLEALMALSVSYTNESMQIQACHMLYRWLKCNPKYSHVVTDNLNPVPHPAVASLMDSTLHGQICDLYMCAARLSPSDIDSDVQCGLGVLFHLSGDYDKAVDCFRAALQVKPNDWQLWNKLGATLANGKRSEEAVQAYYKALELSPGFIRSRFNLGISCINLKAYKEAAEHFLTALNMQAAGRGLPGATRNAAMSESIWSSLHLVISLLERQDLYEAVYERNLELLSEEFGVTSATTR